MGQVGYIQIYRCANVLSENLKDREKLGETGINSRIMLKWILEKLIVTR
jgi:hypothetical protein